MHDSYLTNFIRNCSKLLVKDMTGIQVRCQLRLSYESRGKPTNYYFLPPLDVAIPWSANLFVYDCQQTLLNHRQLFLNIPFN